LSWQSIDSVVLSHAYASRAAQRFILHQFSFIQQIQRIIYIDNNVVSTFFQNQCQNFFQDQDFSCIVKSLGVWMSLTDYELSYH